MNYIQQLNNFLRLSQADTRLRPSHISLYMALFDRWNRCRFEPVFTIHREQLMAGSHIGSKDTLLKCIRELHQAGYIRYQPPLAKFAQGKVRLLELAAAGRCSAMPSLFQEGEANVLKEGAVCAGRGVGVDGVKTGNGTGSEMDGGRVKMAACTDLSLGIDGAKMAASADQEMGIDGAKSDAGTGPVLGHLLKQVNKDLNLGETAAPLKNFTSFPVVSNSLKRTGPPTASLVNRYFSDRGYPLIEGRKFFLHYESTEWMTGGHTPVTNWQAAADKWMLNDRSISKTMFHANPSPSPLPPDTNAAKDYSIPF